MKKRRPYEPIEWRDGVVRYLDQTLLPHEVSYAEAGSFSEVVEAIQRLALRGAPLIGIAGAYATVLASREHEHDPSSFRAAVTHIAEARPTAVNLRHAVDRLQARIAREGDISGEERTRVLLDEATRLHRETAEADRQIADHGRKLFTSPATILTICNTGPLATGGYGTALGVLAAAWDDGHIANVYVCETRPLLQGARLTMWELAEAGVPATLLNDSAAGALFLKGSVDCVIAGADRIASNGDTANKVGTYPLACLADRHGVPFYIAAPTTTIDPFTSEGGDIPVEVRDGDEVTSWGGTRTAPPGVRTFTPAFDVTPAPLITAIVTEEGVFRRPYEFGGGGGTR